MDQTSKLKKRIEFGLFAPNFSTMKYEFVTNDTNFISEEQYQERKISHEYNCTNKLYHSSVERN